VYQSKRVDANTVAIDFADDDVRFSTLQLYSLNSSD
jgi:hypothetical protein